MKGTDIYSWPQGISVVGGNLTAMSINSSLLKPEAELWVMLT